jgi:hypothetical protein
VFVRSACLRRRRCRRSFTVPRCNLLAAWSCRQARPSTALREVGHSFRGDGDTVRGVFVVASSSRPTLGWFPFLFGGHGTRPQRSARGCPGLPSVLRCADRALVAPARASANAGIVPDPRHEFREQQATPGPRALPAFLRPSNPLLPGPRCTGRQDTFGTAETGGLTGTAGG